MPCRAVPCRAVQMPNVSYKDLLEETQSEGEDITGGQTVAQVLAPRPPVPVGATGAPATTEAVHGLVYVQFKDITSATKAMTSLHGRQFDGKTVVAQCVSDNTMPSPMHHCQCQRQ